MLILNRLAVPFLLSLPPPLPSHSLFLPRHITHMLCRYEAMHPNPEWFFNTVGMCTAFMLLLLWFPHHLFIFFQFSSPLVQLISRDMCSMHSLGFSVPFLAQLYVCTRMCDFFVRRPIQQLNEFLASFCSLARMTLLELKSSEHMKSRICASWKKPCTRVSRNFNEIFPSKLRMWVWAYMYTHYSSSSWFLHRHHHTHFHINISKIVYKLHGRLCVFITRRYQAAAFAVRSRDCGIAPAGSIPRMFEGNKENQWISELGAKAI